jgi:hypothetical protein
LLSLSPNHTKISTLMSGILKTRHLHLLLLYLPFLSCTPSNSAKVSERRSDIILLDSYYEQNTPGPRGAPKSTEYFFKIRLNTNNKVLFDSVWIADSCFPVFVSPLSGPISSTPTSHKKNDVILVRASSLSTQANTPPSNVLSRGGLDQVFCCEPTKIFDRSKGHLYRNRTHAIA